MEEQIYEKITFNSFNGIILTAIFRRFKVVLKKGVTLSQQEINKNNKEIEVAFKRDYRLITEATFEGVKTMVSRMMESQMDLPAMDKRTSLKFKKKTEEYT